MCYWRVPWSACSSVQLLWWSYYWFSDGTTKKNRCNILYSYCSKNIYIIYIYTHVIYIYIYIYSHEIECCGALRVFGVVTWLTVYACVSKASSKPSMIGPEGPMSGQTIRKIFKNIMNRRADIGSAEPFSSKSNTVALAIRMLFASWGSITCRHEQCSITVLAKSFLTHWSTSQSIHMFRKFRT